MTDRHLSELLEQLHAELQNLDSVDGKGRRLLLDLDADIRSLLERSGEDKHKTRESILKMLQSSMDYFEITHPRLTMALSEIMTALNNAGI